MVRELCRLLCFALSPHMPESNGPIHHSAETGSGKTTLLFSHLSTNHQVFALDCGDSVTRVKTSCLFNNSNVTCIERPSQLTLPLHVFRDQIAVIDGPHGYPFPDLDITTLSAD